MHARRRVCQVLSDCFINNALIDFVPNCQDTCTLFVNVLNPLLVDLLLLYRPHFVVDRIYIRALGGMKAGVSNPF